MGYDANRTPTSDRCLSPAPPHEADGAPLFRLARLADLRLSPRAGSARQWWDAAVAALNREPPDLVVADNLTLCGAEWEADLAYAAAQLRRLQCPVLALPGPRDIGSSGSGRRCRAGMLSARRDRYLRHFGTDWWLRDVCGWGLIGLDTLLFGSDLDAELDQLGWLEAAILDARRTRPAMLFVHQPACGQGPRSGSFAQPCWRTELGAHAARLLRSASARLLPAAGGIAGRPAWRDYRFGASTITCERQDGRRPARHESFNEA